MIRRQSQESQESQEEESSHERLKFCVFSHVDYFATMGEILERKEQRRSGNNM